MRTTPISHLKRIAYVRRVQHTTFRLIKPLFISTLLLTSANVVADSAYPTRPVQIIVPFPAGGSLDSLIRQLGQQLGQRWKTPVVVENRAGASGIIGLSAAAKAAPDGYTLAAVSNSFVANPLFRKDMPYGVFENFAPVSLLGSVPFVFTVNQNLPVNSVTELVDYAKKHPGQLNYSSGGTGTMSHLGAELLKQVIGIDGTHIPYKGQAPALTDVVTGQVSFTMANLPEVVPYARAGQVKGLAILANNRSTLQPDLPTLQETGFPPLQMGSWYGLVAPQGTPPQIVRRIQQDINTVLMQPEIRTKLQQQGFEIVANSPDEFTDFLKKEGATYKKIIETAGIKSE